MPSTALASDVAVLGWDMSHNALGRSWVLAELLRHAGLTVDLAGPLLLGDRIWPPLADASLTAFPCNGWAMLVANASAFVEAHPRDTVIVSKPRFPSMLMGLMYKKRWGARVIVDVDDWELALVGAREPVDPRRLPADAAAIGASRPEDVFWTRVAEGMMGLADAVTVSNVHLQARFGGAVVRHARDAQLFDRSRYDQAALRSKHGLPADGRLMMFLGTPQPHKRVDKMLRFVLDSGAPDLFLCVTDHFFDPAYRNALVRAGGDRLVLLPPTAFSELPGMLSTASFVCLPQDPDSDVSAYQIPAKLTDAMALRVPVLMSPTPAVADLAARGLFLNSGPLDAASFARAVNLPEAALREVTDRAHDTFMREFSYPAAAGILKQCLRDARNKPMPDWGEPLLALMGRLRPGPWGAAKQSPSPVTAGPPLKLGLAWAGNSINTATFRHHGVLTAGDWQFCAFYIDADRMCIARRKLPGQEVETAEIAGPFDISDAHNAISLGCDRAGYLHLAYGHHSSALRYRRGLAPFGISAWTDELPMTGRHEERVTYPAFLMATGGAPLTMLYRDGAVGCAVGRTKTYDESSQSWTDQPTPLLSGIGRPWSSSPYWQHPAFGADGVLHLAFTWRTHPSGTEGKINNINIDYARSRDNGLSWESSRGQPLRLPMTQVNSETAWPVAPGSSLMNQSGMAVDAAGHPHVVFYSEDADGVVQYQHLWHDGRAWRHNFISRRTTRFVLAGNGTLRLPISRPEIVIDRRNRVYVIFRADATGQRLVAQRLLPPHYLADDPRVRILWPEPLQHAEPVLDRLRWQRDGVLSMLIQKNDQPDHEGAARVTSEPIFLADWRLSELWGD
jgi:hypothetical protein